MDDVNRLKDVSDTLLSDQRSLIETLDDFPATVQNLGQTVHLTTDPTNAPSVNEIDIRSSTQQTSGDTVMNLACLLPQTAVVCAASSALPPVPTVPGVGATPAGTSAAGTTLLGLLKAQSTQAAALAATTLQNGAGK